VRYKKGEITSLKARILGKGGEKGKKRGKVISADIFRRRGR